MRKPLASEDESAPLQTGEEEEASPLAREIKEIMEAAEQAEAPEPVVTERIATNGNGLKATITEFRMDYAISLSKDYNSTRYLEGITLQIEGGDAATRKDKYEAMRERLIARVRNVVWRTLNNLPGEDRVV